MKIRSPAVVVAVLAVATMAAARSRRPATAVGHPSDRTTAAASQTAVPADRLLLPFYEVDTTDPSGTTTLFSVRNQLDVPVEIEIRYFRTDGPQAPQRTDRVTLAAKQVLPVNIRFVDGLQVDADGTARGYVVFETLTQGGLIQGDYYRLTPGQNFATGFRLLNASSVSEFNDLCSLFTSRFLSGGGFDSGTRFIVWVDLDLPPTGAVFDYAVYDQPGNLLLTNSFSADQVAFEVTAETLLRPTVLKDFGAIEFQFADGAVGHVSEVVSAAGRYSVGLEGSCGDR